MQQNGPLTLPSGSVWTVRPTLVTMTVHWTGKDILASAWMGQDTSGTVTVVVVMATSHHCLRDFHAVMDSLEMSTGPISATRPSKFSI